MQRWGGFLFEQNGFASSICPHSLYSLFPARKYYILVSELNKELIIISKTTRRQTAYFFARKFAKPFMSCCLRFTTTLWIHTFKMHYAADISILCGLSEIRVEWVEWIDVVAEPITQKSRVHYRAQWRIYARHRAALDNSGIRAFGFSGSINNYSNIPTSSPIDEIVH